MDVWWNHFLYKALESSNWNNHFLNGCLGYQVYLFQILWQAFSRILFFGKLASANRNGCHHSFYKFSLRLQSFKSFMVVSKGFVGRANYLRLIKNEQKNLSVMKTSVKNHNFTWKKGVASTTKSHPAFLQTNFLPGKNHGAKRLKCANKMLHFPPKNTV